MARMPQIPKIEYGAIPSTSVPRGELPSVEGVVSPIREGANTVSDLGNVMQRGEEDQANALQRALDAKQKIVDTVTATRSSGDFDEGLRSQQADLQQQFLDNPEKAPNEFISRARQMADDAIKAAPNSAVGLSLAQKTAASIKTATNEMHVWAQARMTQKAKSDMTVMVNQATRGAEDQLNTTMLEAYARNRHAVLDPLYENLTDDPKAAKSKLDEEIAKSWATAAGTRDPVSTMRALDEKNGFLADHLTAEDRQHLRKQTEASFEGMGKTKEMNTLKEGVDGTGQAYELLRSGDPRFSVVMDSMKRTVEQKKQAIALDPNMSESSRASQMKLLDKQTDTLRYLDMASRKQSGFDPTTDENVRGKLLADHDKLFDKDHKSTAKDLSSILEFRHDLAKAYMSNQISTADRNRMDQSVSLAIPKALTKEKNDTWHLGLFNWRNPRESGNKALNDLMDPKTGMLGNLTPKQQNDARLYYMEQLNDAMQNGANVDATATQTMARRAAYLAAGKPMPGGGK